MVDILVRLVARGTSGDAELIVRTVSVVGKVDNAAIDGCFTALANADAELYWPLRCCHAVEAFIDMRGALIIAAANVWEGKLADWTRLRRDGLTKASFQFARR